ENPSFTSAAASLRFAAVTRLRAPISSSLPQRPQLVSSFFQPSYSASLTTRGAVWDARCPAVSPKIATARRLCTTAFMLPPHGSEFAHGVLDCTERQIYFTPKSRGRSPPRGRRRGAAERPTCALS